MNTVMLQLLVISVVVGAISGLVTLRINLRRKKARALLRQRIFESTPPSAETCELCDNT